MKSRIWALVAVFLVQVIYGFTFTFANDVIDGGHIKPFGFILIRIFFATLLFWAFSVFAPKEKVDPKDYKTFFLAAIFGIALNMLTFFKGFEYTTPIHASVIMTVVPIVVLILSSIMLNERITKLKILGILIGFSGALILSLYGKSTQAGDNIPLGNLLVFINAVSYSIYLIIIKKLTFKYHPFTFIKWLFLFGLILVAPFGLNEVLYIDFSTFDTYIYFAVGFIIVGATFTTYLLNPLALTRLRASTVSAFLYLQPVVAGIFAVTMGSDTINPVKLIAAACIFCGVYLVTKPPRARITDLKQINS
ncbi:multidrug transporter [Mangrovimonas yunxiaonensis]|uniref:Multidrug transporter n=1 Tax=Mangrovimonas yunxiaonensis TaxID=1197477 RepID=A0A084TL07_9FLAO|nr:DMT family transporter [Mangrovimonas yunxiaonensis]KFB01393.1 multidrug transporter [Mangrovimonas yunxiaonensis]GGH36919.1 multidrug transporter [Mangrovimonas yunxiaonensis]